MPRSPSLRLAITLFAAAIVNSAGAANEVRFEVLSIKPVARGPGVQLAITNPTPNGFTATATLWQLVAFAYGPPIPARHASRVWQSPNMRNEPSWFEEQVYAVDARVSQTDLKAWQTKTRTPTTCFTLPCKPPSKNVASLPSIRNQRNERSLHS